MSEQSKKELTKEEIQQIRKRYATEKCDYKQLAEEFGVSKNKIKEVLKGIVKLKLTVLQRFNEKWSEDENGCHIWNACTDKDGYGKFKMDGKPMRANRVSYQQHKGEIPKGLIVRHTCDNPACVNPDHLILGTQKQNNDDKVERFRDRRKYSAIDCLEMLFRSQINVSEDSIMKSFRITKDTLKRKLKDMAKTADDPAEDKVFYYRGRAMFEEKQSEQEPFNPVQIDWVIE
ncbi:HNH endonuclease signature motif containing protein [Neobacillus massiliamazoniensis]|uniref:HNH nuclease domain-containing protein n=1 Tax=Neobacillus massiliamazoniensis TaxID=1499688 RepID=A0A0U1NY79_9BACI|nr:HNH endonuclease signature motif containing protein [Neobacillus massiliamazoniensis]CRK82989.1 hypothetical protein BN000_02944 [Neobacillus massiliamazoniensis]